MNSSPSYIRKLFKQLSLPQTEVDLLSSEDDSSMKIDCMTPIHIDICIPIFRRHALTRKILKHYFNVKKMFKDTATFTFTIIGSEGAVSKQLVADTIGLEYYCEFKQDETIKKMDMLAKKWEFGRTVSLAKTPDIAFMAGSNDFIPYAFFEGVITQFSIEIPQVYGMGNQRFSNSILMIAKYDDTTNSISEIEGERFFWDGIYLNETTHLNFCGGIIGVNKASYINNNLEAFWHTDETTSELLCYTMGITPVAIPNLYYLNPKTSTDITPWRYLRSEADKTLRTLSIVDDIDPRMREMIEKDIVYFNSL